MAASGNGKKAVILFAILLLVPLFILLFGKMEHTFSTLPYYYMVDVEQKMVDGVMVNDTIYHTIPEFDLINQDGQPISEEYLQGKISVVDFFFTTCTTICPKMSRQMAQLHWLLEDEYFADVRYLSISVDPEYDQPDILKAYAKKMEADLKRWSFATGTKEVIYPLGVEGFKLSTQEDVDALGGFLHSEKFVLVDRKGHIRGYYDGTSVEDRNLLEEDIKMLIGEERREEKKRRKGN